MAVLSDSFFSTRRRYVQRGSQKSRYFITVIILLCLMSLLTLGQTGVVATKGYAVAHLQTQRKELIRQRNQLTVQLSSVDSMERIRKRAEELGLRPVHLSQVQYVTIVDARLHKQELQPQMPFESRTTADENEWTTLDVSTENQQQSGGR